jgi:hypothetical protein
MSETKFNSDQYTLSKRKTGIEETTDHSNKKTDDILTLKRASQTKSDEKNLTSNNFFDNMDGGDKSQQAIKIVKTNNNNISRDSQKWYNIGQNKKKTKKRKSDKNSVTSGTIGDSLVVKTYLSDTEHQSSLIYDKFNKKKSLSDNSDRGAITPPECSIKPHKQSTKGRQITEEIYDPSATFDHDDEGRNERRFAFMHTIIRQETKMPDQIVATNIYINFKFLEFTTAFFTFLGNFINNLSNCDSYILL